MSARTHALCRAVTAGTRRTVVAGALVLLAGASGVLAAPGVAHAETIRDREWYLNTLNIAQAQQISQGAGVIVAVVDSGVWPEHPDLQGQVLPGTGFGGDATSDGSDNGGHGTAMASVIAGKGGNSSHVLGIAPRVKILPISTGSGAAPDQISQGIHYAVDHGAKVVNISEGKTEPATQTSIDAVRYALSKNVVVVSSAGNRPEASEVSEPANVPGVVAVGATDQSNQMWSGSVTGPEVVLAAPGVGIVGGDILGKAPSGYAVGDGTSGAGAIVSATAAMIFAKYPQITAANVINRLIRTAKDLGPSGRDENFGYGLVDPVAALTASVPQVSQNPLLSAVASPSAAPRAAASKKDQGPPIAIGVTNKLGAAIQVGVCLVVVVGLVFLIVFLARRGKRRASMAPAYPAPPGWVAAQQPAGPPIWAPSPHNPPPSRAGAHHQPGPPTWSPQPSAGVGRWPGQQPGNHPHGLYVPPPSDPPQPGPSGGG
jgi:type VII secretion-associated serine protease mycosin